MKLEVIDCSTEKIIEKYIVSDISMLDFQEWRELPKVEIALDQLIDSVSRLDSIDPENSSPVEKFDFYLPDPIKQNVISRRDIEEASLPLFLKASVLLESVAKEITQNHMRNNTYKVRISDEE
jgi:hypothetical protein